jgi:hypothetical protein
MADFTYSSSTGRYRDADGKLVSFRAVRDAVDRTVDEASDRLGRLAERLRSGEITLADFQTSAMATIKDVHLATGIAAHGGKAAMGRATFETVRARDDVARGADEERNVLAPAEHCDQCRSLAALEWVPIGTLPPIGARTCGSNDRCSIRRRGNREIRSVA